MKTFGKDKTIGYLRHFCVVLLAVVLVEAVLLVVASFRSGGTLETVRLGEMLSTNDRLNGQLMRKIVVNGANCERMREELKRLELELSFK